MNVIQEINAMVKKADPTWNRGLWDWLSNPLTCLYAKQNENFKAQQAAASKKAKTTSAPVRKDTGNDELIRIAQGVSNSYRNGSIARPKFISEGRVVAR